MIYDNLGLAHSETNNIAIIKVVPYEFCYHFNKTVEKMMGTVLLYCM